MRANIMIKVDGEEKSFPIFMSSKKYQIDVYGQKTNITIRGNDEGRESIEIYEPHPGMRDPHQRPLFIRGDVELVYHWGLPEIELRKKLERIQEAAVYNDADAALAGIQDILDED
jgi:hypothetical protein